MTVNSQRLTTLQQSLENLLTEKRTLNSKVISDSYNVFKNSISKLKAGQQSDVKTALKRLEQSLKNEGAYKNVKSKFEVIKREILELADNEKMKSIRRDTNHLQTPQKQNKHTAADATKSSNRARTVTLTHAQERQTAKRNGLLVTPVIKRPIIQTDLPSVQNHKTPAIDLDTSLNGRGSPEALLGLNKTISRLFDQLDINKPKHGNNLSTHKPASKVSKTQTKTQKFAGREDVNDVKSLVIKLKIFEDEFQKRKTTQDETLHSLQAEVDRLQSTLLKKEQELDRLKSTHSIVQRAKGKTVEKMAEIHEHEKRDMVVKLQNLELNIKKNLEANPRESEDSRHRQVLETLASEILRVYTTVNKRNKIHRTRSEASNINKEKDSYDDLLPRIVTLGEEIQMLQKSKSELSRDNNDLQIWKTSFAEVAIEVDSLWKDVYLNKNFPDVRNVAKPAESESPRSKAAPIKAKLITAKALLNNNVKKLEEAERKIKDVVGASNSNDMLKKLIEELNKLQSDYNQRLSNSRLSLRSISTNKSDETQEATDVANSLKNIRKILQDYDSRIADNEKIIKEHDNDLEILRHRIVKLGAGVLNDDNIHDTDNDTSAKLFSGKLDTMIKKLEIFDERLKQLQEQNRIYRRQLEGKDSSTHRLAVMETDIQELCNILRVSDTEKHGDSNDKLKTQLRLCKNVSRKITDEKENIERKLAKSIIDVTELTKQVATLHHHVTKINNKSDERRISDSHVIQTAVEETQQKLNEIMQNVDKISMEKDEFKRKHKSSTDEILRIAQKIYHLRQELEGQKPNSDEQKNAEYNYLADLEVLKQNLWKAVGEKRAYIDTIDEKTNQIAELKDQSSKLQIQVTVRENEIKEKTNEIQKLSALASENSREIKQLQDNVEKFSRDKRQLEKEAENTKSLLAKASKELQDVQEEKSQLLRRLSKAMGGKITDGNTAIANLSDPYRPEKLAEHFSQLYDNEWTNAYEILTTMFSMDEKMAVDCLLNVVKESYRFCQKLAEQQIVDVTRTLLMIHKDGTYETGNPDKIQSLGSEDNRQIKDIRRLLAKYSAATVKGLYQTSEGKGYISEEQIEQCEHFVNRCVELCWFMAVSDPPMVMLGDMKSGETIDTNLFRFYTKSGEYSEFVVWPAILLTKQGPVISKGVVQPF